MGRRSTRSGRSGRSASRASSTTSSAGVRERSRGGKEKGVLSAGGRCLIPVFALGRAQELLLILDEYWEAHPELQEIPIYYASSLAKKCMAVYQTFVSGMNRKIQGQIAAHNPFIFNHISNLKSIDHFEVHHHAPLSPLYFTLYLDLEGRGPVRGAGEPGDDAVGAEPGVVRGLVPGRQERLHHRRLLRRGDPCQGIPTSKVPRSLRDLYQWAALLWADAKYEWRHETRHWMWEIKLIGLDEDKLIRNLETHVKNDIVEC